ncbi:hypothetical protein PVAG01_02515 [Phlyctema vagabunda]|uniref:RRM domain-containing protein n=1 Tax=Phlyctema vagabunda TaxID=108571 RepID=A0ABR4PR15_9HELO
MASVTLDKVYFETLLRRAQFHTSGLDFTTPVNLPMVTIPKVDHDSLLAASREFGNLRRNLFNGGISEETLALLVQDDPQNAGVQKEDAKRDGETTAEVNAFRTQEVDGRALGSQSIYVPRNGFNGNWDEDESIADELHEHHHEAELTFGPGNKGFDNGYSYNSSGPTAFQPHTGPYYEKNCKRTVLLSKLPSAVTHAEIVDAVRGGMIIDLYLRSKDRTVSISFLEAIHARNFFRHVKRNDLYLGGKRIEIRWNDRQFILSNNIARNISLGATRNLVVRNCANKHTEETIRGDLEHIHNLVVIKVVFNGHDAHISTNSVHNAMFARTCMKSRAIYRGSKIEWDADECALPIEIPSTDFQNDDEKSMIHETTVPKNRFELLSMERSKGGSDTDDFDESGATFDKSLASTVEALVV